MYNTSANNEPGVEKYSLNKSTVFILKYVLGNTDYNSVTNSEKTILKYIYMDSFFLTLSQSVSSN